MLRSILIYGFPLFLLFLEWLLRLALHLESAWFIGPTLAGIGIGFTLPLTQPRERSELLQTSTRGVLHRHGLLVFSRKDWFWVELAWVAVFVFVACWCGSFYLSARPQSGAYWQFFVSLGLGALNYGVAVWLSVKRKSE